MASKNGNVDCVEILIQAGANVNLCDTKNQTPFFGMCTDIGLIVLHFILSLFENNINSEIVENYLFYNNTLRDVRRRFIQQLKSGSSLRIKKILREQRKNIYV